MAKWELNFRLRFPLQGIRTRSSYAELVGMTSSYEELIEFIRKSILDAQKNERANLIDRGEQLVGIYLNGPLRDSAYSIFDDLKTAVFAES